MEFIRHILETRLSRAFGLPVTMAKFTAAPLSGRIEISELAVGDLIRVKRIMAKVSLAGFLKRQVVIQSLTIDSPAIRVDGPLPRPPASGAKSDASEPSDSGNGWTVQVHEATLVDGSLIFQPPGMGGYSLAVDDITGSVRFADGVHTVAIALAMVGRSDRPVELGAATLTAKVASEAVEGRLRIGETIDARGQAASIRRGPWNGSIEMTLSAAKLLDLLPPTVKLPITQANGEVTLTAAASAEQARRVKVERFTLSTRDVTMR